jgi:hypothetical protein
MKNLLNLFVSTILSLILLIGFGSIVSQQVNAQSTEGNSTSSTTSTEVNKNYILIFGHRIVGNIDNSTKIVSSIVGHNSVKIQEEFLEEISLAPTQQLEEQIEKIVNDGINGVQCDSSLTTQHGENVKVNCISSDNNIIWFIHSAK